MKLKTLLSASLLALTTVVSTTAFAETNTEEFQRYLEFAKQGNSRAQAYVGIQYHKNNDHKNAVKWLEKAIKKEDRAGIYVILGMSYYGMGNKAKAEKTFKKACTLAAKQNDEKSMKFSCNVSIK